MVCCRAFWQIDRWFFLIPNVRIYLRFYDLLWILRIYLHCHDSFDFLGYFHDFSGGKLYVEIQDYFSFFTVNDIPEYITHFKTFFYWLRYRYFLYNAIREIYFSTTPKSDSSLALWPYCSHTCPWANVLLTRFKASKSKDWIFNLNFEIIKIVVYEIPIFHMSQKVD
jgi:hypothetical protein